MKNKSVKGLGGLLPKWHKSVIDDLKRLHLPKPNHDYGFSAALLQNTLTPMEFAKFDEWMYGQTCVRDENLGLIYYTTDVIRGIDLIRNGKQTFWD